MDEQINKELLKELILKNKEGFTIDTNLNFVNKNKGFVVALTDNSDKNLNLLIEKTLSNYNTLKSLSRYKLFFGGWFCDSENKFYLDVSIIIPDKKEKSLNLALDIAKIQNQKAIFNFKTMDCINLK